MRQNSNVPDSWREGTSIQYVTDPDDPSHLIAVGEPSDWERPPLEDTLITVGVVLASLVAGGGIAMRIVPEDLQTALMRFRGRRKPPRRRADGRP